jgi:hypothetical protein
MNLIHVARFRASCADQFGDIVGCCGHERRQIPGNTTGLFGTRRYAIVNGINVVSDDINFVYEIGAEFN